MIFAPRPLGKKTLDPETLAADRKACLRAGPCGLGQRALYLGGRCFERRFYLPWGEVKRVFKRVAMSRGGFTGKGVFGSAAYLVVQFGRDGEKQCFFRRESDIDGALDWIGRERPGVPTHSAAAEKKLAAAEAAEQARFLKELTAEAEATLETLNGAKAFLDGRPGSSRRLAAAARQKRIADNLKPAYLAGGTLVAVLGAAAALCGLAGLLRHSPGAGYFLAGGGAAFFTALASGTLPSRWNSKKHARREWDLALADCRAALAGRDFPVPPQYAHPAVLERMIRAVRMGRAVTPEEALAVVKADLRALNSSVTVSRRDYDEVVAVKPLFLVCDYRDNLE